MPFPAQRLFDLVGPGFLVGPGSLNVTINNVPASLTGDFVSTHGEPPHVFSLTVTGSPTVFINNRPVNCLLTTVAACGHAATTGSPTVFVN